jgi:hypothetical protein
LNQIFQYHQSYQPLTTIHLSISALLGAAHTRVIPFFFDRNLPLYFSSTARSARAQFFARSSLFLEVAVRPSPPLAREIFFSPHFCLPLYRAATARRASTFRFFAILIW